MVFDLAQVGASGRLLATQAGKPPVERLEMAHERLDLADGAALGGLDDVEETVLRFVLGEGGFGQSVDEVEIPLSGHAVAVGEQFLEVVAGFEEDDRHVRKMATQHVECDHVFGLEARGEADGCARGHADNMLDERLGGEDFVICS